MTADAITPEIRTKLAEAGAATLTTCLFKRGFRNAFMQGVRRLNPDGPAMVGEAFTLRYIPAREDLDVVGGFEDREHPQRKAIETCPPGHVLVVDSRKDASAASAGYVLMTRMLMRGVAGFVTDGGLRDTPDIARLEIPVYLQAPSAPPNIVKHHAVELNTPIGCGDVAVYPGDIVVGDNEGVVVVPRHLAAEIAEEAAGMGEYEAYAIRMLRKGRSIFGIYPPSPENRAEYERWVAAGRPD